MRPFLLLNVKFKFLKPVPCSAKVQSHTIRLLTILTKEKEFQIKMLSLSKILTIGCFVFVVSGFNAFAQEKTVQCNDSVEYPIEIRDDNQKLSFSGTCDSINVYGTGNEISLGVVGLLTISGGNNSIQAEQIVGLFLSGDGNTVGGNFVSDKVLVRGSSNTISYTGATPQTNKNFGSDNQFVAADQSGGSAESNSTSSQGANTTPSAPTVPTTQSGKSSSNGSLTGE